MRKKNRGPFGRGALIVALGVIALGGTGITATLWAMGIVDLSFLNRDGVPSGWVAIPVSAGKIPAYTKLSRDHILDPRNGRIKYTYLPADEVRAEVIRDYNKVFGRVLDHEKPAGYAFTESDFLPKGTRAGLVAGIPTGKRSITVEADRLGGVFGLKPGDHIDILATVPIDSSKGGRVGGLSSVYAAQSQVATMQKRASVRPLAQDAVIVSPVTPRNRLTASTSLTSGKQVRNVPVQEIVIAVDPVEVAAISEALATQIEITCVGRSGLPDDPGPASITPGFDPLAEMNVVDSIAGKNRQAMVFSPDGQRAPANRGAVAGAEK